MIEEVERHLEDATETTSDFGTQLMKSVKSLRERYPNSFMNEETFLDDGAPWIYSYCRLKLGKQIVFLHASLYEESYFGPRRAEIVLSDDSKKMSWMIDFKIPLGPEFELLKFDVAETRGDITPAKAYEILQDGTPLRKLRCLGIARINFTKVLK